MTNLVVVAHPDDEILGFGATGARLVEIGETVQPIILCGNVDMRSQRPSDPELQADIKMANSIVGFRSPMLGSFPNIRMNTVPHLDIVRFIEEQILSFQPNRIFTHHLGDLNNDHHQVALACCAAARLFQRNNKIQPIHSLHAMEIPSSTDWAFPGAGFTPFSPNLFCEIDIGFLEKKIKALEAYRRVMRAFPHPRSREALTGLAAIRGSQAGLNYAEAFMTVFQRNFQ